MRRAAGRAGLAALALASCAAPPLPDPHNDLVRFIDALARNVDLADAPATLRALGFDPQAHPGETVTYEGPLGPRPNFTVYVSFSALPVIRSMRINRYSVIYPGGPASFGRTRTSGDLSLSATEKTPHSLCVSSALMTWAFGKPFDFNITLDAWHEVRSWHLPGPHHLDVQVIFSGDGCGGMFEITQNPPSPPVLRR